MYEKKKLKALFSTLISLSVIFAILLSLLTSYLLFFIALDLPNYESALAFKPTAPSDQVTNNVSTIASTNHSPNANAGVNQIVNENTTVVLNGVASDPDPNDDKKLTYLWKQMTGPPVKLSNNNSTNPSFSAPIVSSDRELRFSLTAKDDKGAENVMPTFVTIVVKHLNHSPVASAGSDQTVDAGNVISLDGTKSKDPDGDLLSYIWRQVNGLAVKLDDANTPMSTFIAPSNITANTDLNFKLTAIDTSNASSTDGVRVTIKPFSPSNRPPVANAGQDQTVNSGDIVTLDGAGSSDADDDIASYLWKQISGPVVTLNSPDTVNPSFTAPISTTDTKLGFSLIVNDDRGAKSVFDAVTIAVKGMSVPEGVANVTAPGQGSSKILRSLSSSEDNITTASPSDGYLLYENSTFGFKLSYPSNWYATDGYPLDNTVHFYPPSQNTNTYNGEFAVTIEKNTSSTEDELVNKIISSYAVNPDFTLINSSAKTTLADNPAYQLVLTYSNPIYGKLLVMEVGAVIHETLYRLTYSVNPSNFHLDLPTVQRMIDSFDIFDTSSSVKYISPFLPQTEQTPMVMNQSNITTSNETTVMTTQESANYQFVRGWGSAGEGEGQFNGPVGIAIDSSGNVYVTDGAAFFDLPTNARVQKFDSNGNFITKWGSQGEGDGQFQFPSGVAVDTSGNVIVADNFSSRIQKFDSNGNFITKWGSKGSGDGQFSSPSGVAVDASSNVYVVDNGNSRIQKFDSDGNFITKWGSRCDKTGFYVSDGFRECNTNALGAREVGDGQFSSPNAVAVDTSGNVYVVDYLNNRIQKFDSDGNFITKWGSAGHEDGQFSNPVGVAVDSSGNVYVTDGYDRIQKFDSNGNFITKWTHGGFSPTAIAVDSSGNVYSTDQFNMKIEVFSQKK